MSGAEEVVAEVLRRYPPGGYLFGDAWADEIVDRFFKMDRERFLAMLRHDYTVALLRRDREGLARAREAYRQLSSSLDWGEAPWSGIERAVGDDLKLENAVDDVKKWAKEAAKTLFEVYRDEIAVEGWRVNQDETVWDGLQRGLLTEASEEGRAFKAEWERWFELEMRLKRMLWSEELRTGDRVALWFTKELLIHARIYQHSRKYVGESEEVWSENILTGIIRNKYDYWLDLALLYVDVVVMEAYDNIRHKIPGPLVDVDLLVMALMAVEGIDPRGRSLKDIEAFLEDFSRRTGDEKILEHYRTVKYGGGGFRVYEYAFIEMDKIPEDQRKILEKMREASKEFFSEITDYIEGALEESEGQPTE